MADIQPLTALSAPRFETAPILRQLGRAARQLAELKGIARSIPNQEILINTLGLQEAKDSSAVENIVTTHDQLYRGDAMVGTVANAAAKEVLRYRKALHVGHESVKATGLLTVKQVLEIQQELEGNTAGVRRLPGTKLQDRNSGRVIYVPPQDYDNILLLLTDLERFINEDTAFDADPLVKMAIMHHQFESIHPFYDGNGRTGRILNVLYLVQKSLLDIPVLYLSRYIVRTKAEYYRLLQAVRDDDVWEEWVLYMLVGIEETARQAVTTIEAISGALLRTKHAIRERYRFYSQDLINNLFTHPYTKIQFLERDLKVNRHTATRYLDELTTGGFLTKHRVGRSNYYVNVPLLEILTGEQMTGGSP